MSALFKGKSSRPFSDYPNLPAGPSSSHARLPKTHLSLEPPWNAIQVSERGSTAPALSETSCDSQGGRCPQTLFVCRCRGEIEIDVAPVHQGCAGIHKHRIRRVKVRAKVLVKLRRRCIV